MTTRSTQLTKIFSLALSLLIFQCAEDTPTDTPVTYTVTFNANGGSAVESLTVNKDAKANKPADPTRDGYIFEGWYTDQATTTAYDFNSSVTANLTLYAKWTAIETFTVTFNANGGSAVDSLTVNKDAKANKPADPTRDGYIFGGWYSDQATTTAYDFNSSVTANLTLYAKWTAIEKLVQIPDTNFRAALQVLIGDAFEGNLLDSAHSSVGSLSTIRVDGKKITSLEGIEHFTALTDLYCYSNQLTSLDLSSNTALARLDCSSNNLSSLDLSSNTALTVLFCLSNNLSSLDLSNNTALTKLYCRENNLTSLELSSNTALTVLSCLSNNLSSLELSSNTALTELKCYDNQLTGLDLSSNTALTELQCYDNQLTGLDLSSNTALTELQCYDNQLTSLDVRGIKSLNLLRIDAGTTKNPITQLNVHTNLQIHSEIQEAKTNRGAAITISTYNDANALVCTDFDPTEGTAGTCKD